MGLSIVSTIRCVRAAGTPAPVSVFVVLFTGKESRKPSRTPRKKVFAHARFYIDKPGDPLPERLRGRFKIEKYFQKTFALCSNQRKILVELFADARPKSGALRLNQFPCQLLKTTNQKACQLSERINLRCRVTNPIW